MYTVRVYNNVSSTGLDRLSPDHFVRDDEHPEPDVIIVRSQQLHDVELPDSVRAIGRAGAGVNNIPVDAMTRRGVCVFNTPGANANAVRELVATGLLLRSRNVLQAWDYTRSLEEAGDALHVAVEAGKKRFAGSELKGKRIAIIGLGAIGRSVAQLCLDFGMKVTGYDPALTVAAAWGMPSQIRRAETVESAVSECDFVSVHVPLLDATRNLVNTDLISEMPDHCVVLNFARGEIVSVPDMVKALDAGELAAYVTDFPQQEFRQRDDVIALPHLGASTAEAEENCAIMVATQLSDFMLDGTVVNSVNFPSAELARETPHRLFVTNANVPNMVGQISTAMADGGLNIHDMLNKSRGDIACTVVDTDSPVSNEVRDKITTIPGVLGAWLL